VSAPGRIQIVGGGLAGLTLGIALRRRGIPTTIVEAGNYPRHRVCGEFISGRGLEVLEALGLKQKLFDAGAIQAKTAAFFLKGRGAPLRALPTPALCVSRFVMDGLLADDYRRLGGELRAGERWENGFGDGVVRATGRRAHPLENGWRWFGLKAHAKDVTLAADLEMHVGDDGYVGLCRLADGDVNVCGLFRRKGKSDSPRSGFELLRGRLGTALNNRLARAQFDESSFCSVAGLSLAPQSAAENAGCSIGDALTMIPPVTGNGMSMAFESAELAVDPLAAFSRGELTWNQTRDAVARLCDEKFSRRLLWSKWLQAAMFSFPLAHVLFSIVAHDDFIWRLMFEKTR
jgi:menaquinone-9 beta-reductase